MEIKKRSSSFLRSKEDLPFSQRQSVKAINSHPQHFLTPAEQREARRGSQRPLVLTTKPPHDITGSKATARFTLHLILTPQETFSHVRRATNTSGSNTCCVRREKKTSSHHHQTCAWCFGASGRGACLHLRLNHLLSLSLALLLRAPASSEAGMAE